MKQQTAVEWLIENLPARFKNALINECSQEIEQALEMEKEQMHQSFISGGRSRNDFSLKREFQTFEQFYKETYEK